MYEQAHKKTPLTAAEEAEVLRTFKQRDDVVLLTV
jgi:hypothetical protein